MLGLGVFEKSNGNGEVREDRPSLERLWEYLESKQYRVYIGLIVDSRLPKILFSMNLMRNIFTCYYHSPRRDFRLAQSEQD